MDRPTLLITMLNYYIFAIIKKEDTTMSTLKLIRINKDYLDQMDAYKQECIANGEDSFHGTAGIEDYENLFDWMRQVLLDEQIETVRQGFVPATTFISVRLSDNKIVGIINIRHKLNEYLLKHGGHIGYSIRPSERKKGYSTEQLKLALIECKKLGLCRVLITCDKNNLGSKRTIEKNNGILENEVDGSERTTLRYWINIE